MFDIAKLELAELKIYLDDSSSTLAEITYESTKLSKKLAASGDKLDLIIIDYIQLMTGGGSSENRQQEISFISRSLKKLARKLDTTVIALSQLSRAVEQRADKKPMLSDLRESGSLEQDPDIVLMLFREEYYDKETSKKNIATVLIEKSRHGATGEVDIHFNHELVEFGDLLIQKTDLNE